jgi:hypothetical protein
MDLVSGVGDASMDSVASILAISSCASSLDPVSGASFRPLNSSASRTNSQLLRSTADDPRSRWGGDEGHLRFLGGIWGCIKEYGLKEISS